MAKFFTALFAVGALCASADAAVKRNPNHHVATNEQLVIREPSGNIKFGVDAGNSFRAEQRMANGEVSGVYSWLKPGGTPGMIGYTSGKHGYQAKPLSALNFGLPPFPKYLQQKAVQPKEEGDMIIQPNPAFYSAFQIDESAAGFDPNPDPEENEEKIVDGDMVVAEPATFPERVIELANMPAAQQAGFIEEKHMMYPQAQQQPNPVAYGYGLPYMYNPAFASYYPQYQGYYNAYQYNPAYYQPQGIQYGQVAQQFPFTAQQQQQQAHPGLKPSFLKQSSPYAAASYTPSLYSNKPQPSATYYGAAKFRNPLDNVRYYGAAKPMGFATPGDDTTQEQNEGEVIAYAVNSAGVRQAMYKPNPTNRIPIRPDDVLEVEAEGRTALLDEVEPQRYGAASLAQFVSQFKN